MERHEASLLALLEAAIAQLPAVTVHSRAAVRTSTLLLTFDGHDAAAASQFLAERDILVPASNFYAIEAVGVLGLGAAGGLRVGLAPYTNLDDVQRLIEGLTAFLA
ncbi:aminotransferase class V-fold PLP-dependent enzyme [Arthrobacter sp. TB 23]|uniref:aminotransferase class V-fold PLP-dependent enzyme n=1 Tax=Arthrobacter sp. TB 23 TaxID=494419 RepID=UPI00307992BC